MAGRMSDTVGTKRAIVLGLGIVLSGVLTFSRPCCKACPR
jgi:fucose permease